MDYEKLYKKALERASKLRFQNPFDTVSQMMEHVFPELAESDDERIRKELIEHIKANECADYVLFQKFSPDNVIAWLEKQGEKPHGKTALEAAKEISPAESLGISPEKYEEIVNECIYGESVDKVEPKFKAGDWITDGIDTTQIDSVDDRFYWHDNNRIGGRIDAMDKAYHLWTIQDAKDGDILVNGSNIFIFSHLSDIARVMGYCHINLDDGRFYDDKGKNECFGLIDTVFSPATKEQCDLLFAKMKEAGYEWNAEKKELRKIEPNLSNSAKIEKDDTLLDLLNKMPSYITVDGIDYHFVLKKTIAYMAFYEGEGEGSGKVIFWMAGEPIELLTTMLGKLKEKGLLESF